MNMKKRIAIVLSLGVLLPAMNAAHASGLYLGAAVSGNQFNAKGPSDNAIFEKGQSFSDKDTGYRLNLGYAFSDSLSAELSFNDYGDTTDSFAIKKGIFFIVSPNTIQDISAKSVVLAVKASHSMNERVSVFGTLGVANTKVDSVFRGGFSPQQGALKTVKSTTEQGIEFGVGTTFAIQKGLDLRWDLKRTDAGDLSLNQLSVGLDYHF